MANIVPEKTLAFAVYIDGSDSRGIADGSFPNLEFSTTEIKGAGIAGTVDSPGIGLLGSISIELNWRTRCKNFLDLAKPGGHTIELYADDLSWDAGKGAYVHSSVRAFIKAVTKSLDLGKLAEGDSAEAKTEHEVYYIKLTVDGKTRIEADKYNFIYKVDGTDYLAEARKALGY